MSLQVVAHILVNRRKVWYDDRHWFEPAEFSNVMLEEAKAVAIELSRPGVVAGRRLMTSDNQPLVRS